MPNLDQLDNESLFNQPLCDFCFEFFVPFLNKAHRKTCFQCEGRLIDRWQEVEFKAVPDDMNSREVIYFRHHPSIQSLIGCKTEGCTFCEWLIRHISENDLEPDGEILLVVEKPTALRRAHLCKILPSRDLQRHCSIKIANVLDNSCLEAEPSQLENPLRSLPQMLPARDSISAIAANAKKMLDLCTSSHENCATIKKPNAMPTRVIDVGTLECSSLRLTTTAKAPPQRYAIMSYRWGIDGSAYKLFQNRLEDYHRGIPKSELPATLVDAIDFTRQLGIRYLWIDALCILQDGDDRTDWNIEAPKMGEYYRSADVCISALGAPSAESGLFRSADFELAIHKGVTVGPTPCGTKLRVYEINNDVDETQSFGIAFDSSPLNFRGWTLQERLLSRRLLHIGINQVFLECSSSLTSERGLFEKEEYRTVLPTFGTFLSLPKFAEFRTQVEETPEKASQESILQRWYELVMEYGPRKLTEEGDRLMAFDGLRMLFQSSMRCKYFYGVWEADICNGLLWFIGTHGFNAHAKSSLDPQSINLFEEGSSIGTSSGGSYSDLPQRSSYILGSFEQPRQFWYGHSFQRQQVEDEPQEPKDEKDIEAASQTEIQNYTNNNVDEYATSTLLSTSLPTWSWASWTASLNSCVVETQATIKHCHEEIPRIKVDVTKLGHMKVLGAMKPFIAMRATIVKIELVQGRMISSLQYSEPEQGGRRLVVARGASNVYLDRKPSEPTFTTDGLIMYESGYREKTPHLEEFLQFQKDVHPERVSDWERAFHPQGALHQSLLTLLLVKKAQIGEQDCIEGGNGGKMVYERIGLGFLRHDQALQSQVDKSELDCRETVYLI